MNQSKPPFSAAERSQVTWYGCTVAGSPAKVITSTSSRGDRHDLVLAELDRLAGVLDEGGDVGGEEVLALADPDHQRRVPAGGDHRVGLLGVDRDQGEGTLEPAADRSHAPRSGRRPSRPRRPSSWAATSVSVWETGVIADLGELGAEQREVLDDAVVHEGDPAVRRRVRVGVGVGRAAVGGPAGVADGQTGHRQRVVGQLLLQVGQLARALGQPELARRRRAQTPAES